MAIDEIILGIDPGLASTGFGVIHRRGRELTPLWYGCHQTPADQPTSERLVTIHDACAQVLTQFSPTDVALETLFFGASAPTALAVGQARGVCILAAASRGLESHDYTPSQIKQAVTGYGRADKQQVQQMVQTMLKMTDVPRPDHAADALAVAICHSAAGPLSRSARRSSRAARSGG